MGKEIAKRATGVIRSKRAAIGAGPNTKCYMRLHRRNRL